MAKGSGTGKGGKSFQDRELAACVRNLALHEIERVLKRGRGRLYEHVLVRLAGAILPRLSEVSSEAGAPVVIEISETVARKYQLGAGLSTPVA